MPYRNPVIVSSFMSLSTTLCIDSSSLFGIKNIMHLFQLYGRKRNSVVISFSSLSSRCQWNQKVLRLCSTSLEETLCKMPPILSSFHLIHRRVYFVLLCWFVLSLNSWNCFDGVVSRLPSFEDVSLSSSEIAFGVFSIKQFFTCWWNFRLSCIKTLHLWHCFIVVVFSPLHS